MNLSKRTWFELLGIVFVSLVLYWPSFQFDFVNYDDQVYVLNNTFIHHPSWTTLLNGSGTGNFHPVTMISLWLDYELGSGSSSLFHFTNVVWHLLNSMLVFFFVGRVFPNKIGASFFVALLFAIHPMHIESVAWISSRKDVLYTFFYLISLITYFDYLKTKQKKYLMITIGAAVISLLSKPAAITLPVALVLIQYFEFGRVKIKSLLPLTPLFIGSIIIGLLTIQLQSQDAINDIETYSVFERLGFALYGLFFYIVKSILPVGLSSMHPYPNGSEMLDLGFLLSMAIGAMLLISGVVGIRKNRTYGFGILFFLLNIVLMLQLVSIGRAIVAERYSYLSYLGLFVILVAVLNEVPQIKINKSAFYIISVVIGLPFLIISSRQLKIWENSETLWNKAILENPQDWFGYIGRGNYYKDISKNTKALTDFRMAIQLAPDRFDNYFNLGDLQHQMGQTQEAIETYSQAILLQPDYEQAYINRGQFYIAVNDGAKALADFNQVIAIDPNSFMGYNNRGNLYLLVGNLEDAISDFNKAIDLNPNYAKAWYNRGTAQLNSNLEKAKHDLEQAIAIDPNYFDALNNLGSVYYQTQEFERSIQAYTEAIQINTHAANTWLNLSVVRNSSGDYLGALESALQARKEGAQVSDSYLNHLRSKLN
jgi:tetratricopeptide (TPR) repeat protein